MKYVLKLGEDATLAQIERASRCSLCGVKGKAWAEPVIRYEEPEVGGFTQRGGHRGPSKGPTVE